MKKTLVVFMAASFFTAAVPVMAKEHCAMHAQHDVECERECDLLLKNCAQEVDSIQQRIQRIQTAIKTYGAKPEHVEELKLLNRKLKESNEELKALTKSGR